MRVPLHVVQDRRRRIAEHLREHSYATVGNVCEKFAISEATARRDLLALAGEKRIVRTYGGALAEYRERFPSFRDREQVGRAGKRRIAAAARKLVEPGTTVYLDFGTTIHALAEALGERPPADLIVVTNNLPVSDLLTMVAGIRVFLLGGELIRRQSALLGAAAVRAVRHHVIDVAFLSAEAGDSAGLWNSQDEIVAVQRAVLERSKRSIVCLDQTKFELTAPSFLAPWDAFDAVVTDAPEPALRRLDEPALEAVHA